MSKLTLQSIYLRKKGDGGMVWKFRKNNGIHSSGSESSKEKVHPDLYNAVQKLRVHYAILNKWLKEKEDITETKVGKFEVTGYIIKEKGESEGIVITGFYTHDYGVSSPDTPLMSLDKTKNPYSLIGDLIKCVKAIEKESLEFIENDKQAQLSMDLREGGKEKVTKMHVAEDLTKKEEVKGGKAGPGGTKKVPQSANHRDGTVKE